MAASFLVFTRATGSTPAAETRSKQTSADDDVRTVLPHVASGDRVWRRAGWVVMILLEIRSTTRSRRGVSKTAVDGAGNTAPSTSARTDVTRPRASPIN